MAEKRVGVIGWPIEHSLSPPMHNAAFAALDMHEWHYDANAIPPDILKKSIREFMMHGYIGLNVTVPFKREVVGLMRADDVAKAVGAANTLVLPRNQCTNTDVQGLIDDLRAHDVPLQGENVLVLGAGGAARAAVYGLLQAGAHVAVSNRTEQNAHDMIAAMSVFATVKSPEEALDWGPSLIINATPVGMWPHVELSPWPAALPLPQDATIYDMIYRPEVTTLMKQAEDEGLRAVGGLGMLVRQGAASFEIWTQREAPVGVMFDAVKRALEERRS